MFDPLMLTFALAHLAGLGAFWTVMLRRWSFPWRESLIAGPLLFWATLVLGSQGASLFHLLGSLPAYVVFTFLAAGLLAVACESLARLTPAAPLLSAPSLSFAPLQNPALRRRLFWFFGGTLALFTGISLLLGFSVYPDNADSMIYRLPRAFWYVSNGSFLHPFDHTIDQRLVFYPLSGVALYLPFVLYALPGTAHALPSLCAWAGIVYLTYRFARGLGGDRLIGLMSAWLVGLTPGILAQATSTNDEIIAAMGIVAGFYMLWQWGRTGSRLSFLLAGLAIALSASTKLHIVFLLPIALLALLTTLLRRRPAGKDALKIWQSLGPQTFLLTFVLMAVIFTPFLFYNYASTGRPYFLNNFKDDVFNLSANIRISFQNLVIYFSQLVLSPIADLNVWPNANDRLAFNNILNKTFAPTIRSLLSDDPSFYHLGYRFQGITLPVSVRFVEFSLWSGFVWMLWFFQARAARSLKSFPLREILLFVALTPLLWLVLWSFSTLYMEGTATYYTFYLICAAPVAALTYAAIERERLNRLRWMIVGFVVATNLVIGHNLVMFSGFRALPDLVYARSWPYDWLLTEKPIIDEIRNASRIRIAFTHEKMPYFGYMHWNPRAKYYTPYMVDPDKLPENPQGILQLLPISSLSIYGYMPLKIAQKPTLGVTYLGAVRAIGREAIFASGANVHLRYPDESDYIIGRVSLIPEDDGRTRLTYSDDVAGLNPGDDLSFEHILQLEGRTLYVRPPNPSPAFETLLPFNPNERPATLTTIVRSLRDGQERARATYQVGAGNAWLPDPGDY